jgi:hypothetical protein
MVDFSQHRQALLCNDAASIRDYTQAMAQATQAVAAWLQNDKMYTGGSIKELRRAIAFNPSKEGMGVQPALQRMVELFLNKSLKVHHPHSLAHLHCPTMVASQNAVEAKDIGDKDLEGKKKTGNQEQFDRYKTGLSNLIITDYIDFHFYTDGVFTTKVSIGKLENGSILPIPENFDRFSQLFKNFTETISQSIKSPTRLAEMMAGKARLMADIIERSLNEDDENGNMSNVKRQMLSFQKMLIHDIDNKSL